jgi:hypothetical protein
MSKQNNYLFLAGVFFVVFLVLEFTSIYGDSGWFTKYVLVLSVVFLITGIANRRKNSNKSQ